MPVKRQGVTYVSVTELAGDLDVHRNTVIYWIDKGFVKAVRLGVAEKSPYMIPWEEAERVKSEYVKPA